VISDDTDASLVTWAAAGDQAAFATLAHRHGPTLAKTVRALGVGHGDVEDTVQLALIACWRNMQQCDPGRSFIAWASVIAANKARDWRRRAGARRRLSEAYATQRHVEPASDETDAAVTRLALNQAIKAIGDLPEHLRVALVLTAVTGLTQTEAAKALGVSAKALEGRVLRARQSLLKQMKEG
jgi:RNA polymerase sigma factor CnrH